MASAVPLAITKEGGLYSLLKTSSFDFVLKGRGFKPRRKCHKINSALAAEAASDCSATFSANCLTPEGPLEANA
jgi:hypothetical protein